MNRGWIEDNTEEQDKVLSANIYEGSRLKQKGYKELERALRCINTGKIGSY